MGNVGVWLYQRQKNMCLWKTANDDQLSCMKNQRGKKNQKKKKPKKPNQTQTKAAAR